MATKTGKFNYRHGSKQERLTTQWRDLSPRLSWIKPQVKGPAERFFHAEVTIKSRWAGGLFYTLLLG